jgi:DNA-directed RNA polymerase I and III subunit RPAC1
MATGNASVSFKNFKYEGKDTLTFQLVNSHVSYANTLRRIMLVEIPSVGFRAEILKDGSSSDVLIEKNTTAMSNEMLAHRIGLIPIHANPSNWNPNKYQFRLNVENTNDKPLDVKVADIEVYERNDDDELIKIPNTKFFHPDPITHDTCLLTVLKPRIGNANPESVAFKAKATVGIGRENIRFSPTSQCSYSYTRDDSPEKIKEIFIKWLDRHKKIDYVELENDKERKELYIREFNTMEAQRCYVINEKGEPNSFDFVIESIGIFDPMDILIESLRVIEKKCYAYAAVDKEVPENVKIQPTKKEARGFDIYFQNEDHTLGNLLSTWIDENLIDPNNINENTIKYTGYCVPHPLRDEMMMTIIAKDDLVCRKAISAAAANCGKMFASWRESVISMRR